MNSKKKRGRPKGSENKSKVNEGLLERITELEAAMSKAEGLADSLAAQEVSSDISAIVLEEISGILFRTRRGL